MIVSGWGPFRPIPEGGVRLYTSPWVSGSVADAYFGSVAAERFLPDSDVYDRAAEWEELEQWVLEQVAERALFLGGNAVVGLEVHLDPFFERNGKVGLRVHACGTVAVLRELGC